ncbi:response regulator transcription factor [Sphingomonas sp. dw_22]|uniref:response regulator transcription factor n=1 Tax=Sphingomonas sp. dw_22 TaxID=2721175 RepID=UPI001BD23167|nr:response regulator transcription factor [Sphingomonas sp. dw_22]
MRIAILEDEKPLANELESNLVHAGHTCIWFNSGQKLINQLLHDTFDVLLLDWNVPDVTGFHVVNWVKQNMEKRPPMLILTSRAEEEDIVAALQAGADDYLVKPPVPAVLLARIEAVCRRTYPEPPADGMESYGDYVFDIRMEKLSLRGENIQVTAKEFGLALMLFRNLHRTLSRTYIFEALWGGNPDLMTRTLDAHVSKVRTKLGLRAVNGYRLVPAYAYGYRLETVV